MKGVYIHYPTNSDIIREIRNAGSIGGHRL